MTDDEYRARARCDPVVTRHGSRKPKERRFRPHHQADAGARVPDHVPNVNPDGTTRTLQPRHPGNTNAARHGVYRLREPRAQEIADAILAEPHTVALDAIGAAEIGRIEALIEEIARSGIATRGGTVKTLVDVRLRASRRLAEWLDRYGATPKGRAEWARQLAEGESLAETIRRQRQEYNRGGHATTG